MANQNTVTGIYNVPAQVITGTSETALLVPAAGLYPGFPSPQFPAASGLSVSAPQDIAGGVVDLHEFKIRLVARIANPGGGNFTLKMYQVPFASLGTISATGSVTSLGAPGSGDNVIDAGSAAAAGNPSIYAVEYQLIWSSVNATLGGTVTGIRNASTLVSLASISAPLSSNVAAVSALNFMPSFTFATGNAGNFVQVSEFVIERV